MKKILLFSFLTVALIATGCTTQSKKVEIEAITTELDEVAFQESAPSPQTQVKTSVPTETVTYKIEFKATWSAETHPDYYPEDAHFFPFVAFSHKTPSFIRPATNASPGTKDMAETGKTAILNAELDQEAAKGLIYEKTQGKRIDSPGTDSGEIRLNQNFSYLTFVSMIAPSPDWFVYANENLFQDNQWLEKKEITLIAYDAGTNSGTTFTAEDLATVPVEKINNQNLDFIKNLGTLTLTKVEPKQTQSRMLLCTAKPEGTALGRDVYPIDEEYKHLEFLGQLFTASGCSQERLSKIFGMDGTSYTLGSGLWLKQTPSANFLTTLKTVGFSCDEEVKEDTACVKWKLEETVPATELLKLKPFANEIEKDDCHNCG